MSRILPTLPMRRNILALVLLAVLFVTLLALFTDLADEAIASLAGAVIGVVATTSKEILAADARAETGECELCGKAQEPKS